MPEIAGFGGRVAGAMTDLRHAMSQQLGRSPILGRLPRGAVPVGAAAAAMLVGLLALMPGEKGIQAQENPSLAEPVPEPQTPPVTASAAPLPRPDQLGAQQAAPEPAIVAVPVENLGAVTRLPLPRYVSLKGNEGNARRGPSLSHRIDWVFKHAGMPLRVVAEYGHWRRVVDSEGAGGWVHYALLSGVRTAIIQQDMADLRARPDPNSAVVARAEYGAVVRLGECNPDWCRISAPGASGWVTKPTIWGVDPGETRE